MPLSPMGILHTVIGSLAIFCGIKMLWQSRQISYKPTIGKIYLFATLFTAASALTIFKHGGFNAAHGLAILTLLAVFAGMFLERVQLFRSWNKYFVNLSYSSTFLFHMIPTATEILTRFPMESPIVNSLKDPLLHKTFLAIFVVFMILLIMQMKWLHKRV